MTALLELLSMETGASYDTLRRVIASAPRRYKVYQIPKRNGGMRTIAHPAQELKFIQRILLHSVFDKLPVSDIATAYVAGRGIAFNARQHAGRAWLLKLDFKNFFHSIRPPDWDRIARRTPDLRELAKDRDSFHRILFWGLLPKQNVPTCLSIGAPTSPSVSNLACLKLDQWMIDQAKNMGVRVTRYADDITVSGPTIAGLLQFEKVLKARLEGNLGLRLAFNEKKRGLYGPGELRMVTGLVLTPEGNVSIGRKRKREIHALVHKFSINSQEPGETLRTKGLVAFSMSAEPAFLTSLKEKYGSEIIGRLMKFEPDIELGLGAIDL
jgi:RNA-directed DNA polymerase